MFLKLHKMSAHIFLFLFCVTTILSPGSSKLHYCYTQSEIAFTIFNLTTLYNEDYDSSIRLNDFEHLRIRFCRPLKDPCNGKQGYAVCLHSNDKEIGVGVEPPNVTALTDKIMVRFRGDACNSTHNYTVDVAMKCNFSKKKQLDEHMDAVYHRNECAFKIILETPAACVKRRQTTCELTNESGYFNLKPLMDPASNYIIKLSTYLSIIFNVCQSLIYGPYYSQCDQEVMVCLIDETNAAEPIFTRLGNVNKDVTLSASNGSLYLNLTSDMPCGVLSTGEVKNITTTIEFVCNENATNKMPQYTSGFGTCHYRLTWVTAAACSEDVLIKQSKINSQPCKVMDPVYKEFFDLSKLEGQVAYVESMNETAKYELSICSPLKNSSCTKEGTGVCKYINGTNIALSKGLANANLIWKRNRILLNYTDGVSCGNYRRSYTTIILECRDANLLIVNDTDPCATIINWWTSAICDHRCRSPDTEIDFQKFKNVIFDYEIPGDTPGTTYYLNICEPLLNENNFSNCTYGTGICKVHMSDNGTITRDINLGYAESRVRKAPDGRMYLSYSNGSVCEEDPSKRISSEITFVCDEDYYAIGNLFFLIGESILTSTSPLRRYFDMHVGVESFESYKNCKYDFVFKSHSVCPVNSTYFSEQCAVYENIKKFDLNLLIENYRFKMNPNNSTGYFNGSACGDSSKCHGTFICNNRTKYTKTLAPKRNHLPKLIVFKFENKTECKNETYIDSWFNVWCHIHVESAESFFVKDEECSMGIDWDNTVSFCPINNNAIGGLKAFLIILAVIMFAILVILFYYFRLRERRINAMRALHNSVVNFRYRTLRRNAVVVDDNDDDDDEVGVNISMH